MIELTGTNGEIFLLNIDMIYKIEQHPDTIITLANGKSLHVEEDKYEVLDRIIEYKRRIFIGRLEEI